jgi:ribose 5-phosphate isomerase A
MTSDQGKRLAAERACDLVETGMKVGLGTGSTAALFVAELGRRSLDIIGVPTSEATRRQAESLGIRLATLDEEPALDLTIDGADEIDPALNLIKGGGGALLREKLVAAASRRMVVVADASKQVHHLGRFPLPVEVVPFGLETTRRRIAGCLRELELQAEIRLRRTGAGEPFRTDGGNLILDLPLGDIPDPHGLAAVLKSILGVVEHGLFVAMASRALIGGPEGVIEASGN